MGVDLSIIALTPDTDPTYQKQKAVVVACLEAGVEKVPAETAKYFGNESYTFEEPEDIELEARLEVDVPMKEWKNGYSSEGYEILVKDIPEGVEKLRVYMSW